MVKVKKNPEGEPQSSTTSKLWRRHIKASSSNEPSHSWRNDGEVCAAEAEGFCGAESQRMGEERSGRSPRSFFSRAALHDGPLLKNEER